MKKTVIIPSEYHDSVVLMRIAAQIKEQPGVLEAALFMGTPANHEILAAAEMATDESGKAGPDDLLIVVKAETEEAASVGVAKAQELLRAKKVTAKVGAAAVPRSFDGAIKAYPEANLACFSIPGPYVRYEAAKALERSLNLFIFSDNVSYEDEKALKQAALGRNLLCMGPDCGTAYINGYGLGFYNAVSRGRVGVVASSGTGLQAMACALDAAGEGLSHGIGVGGRDLHPNIGGMMTLAALEALEADAATEVIVLVAKEPHPEVLPLLDKKISSLTKPVVLCFLGVSGQVAGHPVAATLDDAVAMVLRLLNPQLSKEKLSEQRTVTVQTVNDLRARIGGGAVRINGFFTGGTLAHEAHYILEKAGVKAEYGRVSESSDGSFIIDLGDDEYTVGRPHPMIDPSLRNEMISRVDTRGGTVVVLFDLVLGRGSHPDPAKDLSLAMAEAAAAASSQGGKVVFLGSIVGTREDFQGFDRQKTILAGAGAILFSSNGEAAHAATLLAEQASAKNVG